MKMSSQFKNSIDLQDIFLSSHLNELMKAEKVHSFVQIRNQSAFKKIIFLTFVTKWSVKNQYVVRERIEKFELL